MTYIIDKNPAPSTGFVRMALAFALGASGAWFLGVWMTATACMGAL